MAYSGSIDLISGIRPKNGGTFPLVNAHDVYVDDSTRLDEALRRTDATLPATGTTAHWQSNENRSFIPAMGQIVVWTDHSSYTPAGSETPVSVPGVKIGDGTTYNLDLPFADAALAAQLTALVATHNAHEANAVAHITAEDRARWNNKITTSDSVSGDTLILTRD